MPVSNALLTLLGAARPLGQSPNASEFNAAAQLLNDFLEFGNQGEALKPRRITLGRRNRFRGSFQVGRKCIHHRNSYTMKTS